MTTESLSLHDVGRRVAAWRRHNFGEQPLYRHLAQLTEEAGEVAEAAEPDGDLSTEARAALGKEIGDVILAACGLVAVLGLHWDGRVLQDWPEGSRHQRALRLSREVGGVARAIGKAEEGIRPETRGSPAEALYRVVQVACHLATGEGINVAAIVQARLARMESLDFRSDPEGGEAR